MAGQALEIGMFVIPIILGGLGGFAAVAVSIGRYKEKIEQLEKCCAGERISKIEGKFEVIQSFEPMVKRGSPLQLTEIGEKVLTESGFAAFIDQHFDAMLGYLRNCVTDSRYDVQQCSKNACEEVLENYLLPSEVPFTDDGNLDSEKFLQRKNVSPYKEQVLNIKEWLFENGYLIGHLVDTGTVYLRDKAIPEIFTEAA